MIKSKRRQYDPTDEMAGFDDPMNSLKMEMDLGRPQMENGMELMNEQMIGGDNENEICQKCHKAKPDHVPVELGDEWVMCDRCLKWYHIICMGYQAPGDLPDGDFFCSEDC